MGLTKDYSASPESPPLHRKRLLISVLVEAAEATLSAGKWTASFVVLDQFKENKFIAN